MLDIIAICLVLTAALAYTNTRFVGLPLAIGVMATALVLVLLTIILDRLGVGFGHTWRMHAEALIRSIDFTDVLMQGMLSLLLFAGALHVDLAELRTYRWQVGALAVVSTVLSTAAIGLAAWILLPWFGIQLSLLYCLLFGALVSPTDPVAVLGILKSAGLPRNLLSVIAGESLFNDGVGVVVFSLLLGILVSGSTPTVAQGAVLLLHEAGGGLLFGLVLGAAVLRLLKPVDSHQVEVLLTLAAVMGGYALASRLGVSGPLAMVVVGLMIGNGASAATMSETSRRYLDVFWELVDEMLNAVLFLLIGLELLVLPLSLHLAGIGALAIVITLAARALTVGLPVALWRRAFNLQQGAEWVLVWGGLRGGISVALALSLPAGAAKNVVLALTYCVVVFSILVQGLTVRSAARRALRGTERAVSD